MQAQTSQQNRITRIDLDSRRSITANTTVAELLDKWLAYKKNFVKESTHANWVLIANNQIKPFLHDVPVGLLNEGDLQDFILYLHTDGKKDGGGGFTTKAIHNIMLPLQMALQYAYKYNRSIPKLEFDCLEYPHDTKQDSVRAMSYEQQRRFAQTAYLHLDRKTAMYLITLYTGLRIGEACALQMQDISLEQHTISVNKTVSRIYHANSGKTNLIISKPKTRTSVRTIPFPEMLIPVIEPFYHEKCPDNYFLSDKRKPIEPRTLRQAFKRFLKRYDLPDMKFHELRHTFATRAMEIPDFDIKSLSAILGHTNPAFTLQVYGRANIEQETECMKLMNKLL